MCISGAYTLPSGGVESIRIWKLNYMRYFFILFLAIVSCKENKKLEGPKVTVKQEVVESGVPFYDLFLKFETEQELFHKFPLDTSKYYKTYVYPRESKLIDREFEDIKPSDILNEAELKKLESRRYNLFEGYQWDDTINRSKFNTDFLEKFKLNSKKIKSNKTEVIYFFTYPFSISKDKVLIGFEVNHKSHPKETLKKVYMGFIIFEKIDGRWDLTVQESLLEY